VQQTVETRSRKPLSNAARTALSHMAQLKDSEEK